VKPEHARRAVTLFLCLLACAVVIVVALGTGTAVNVATAATVKQSPADQLSPDLHIDINDLIVVAPTITDVNPNGGLTTGGTAVVITGTHLSGATAVTFGTTAAPDFTVNSATQITATAPAHAAGTVQVKVTTAGGTTADTSADDYTYVAAPATTAT
jgi:hypothetical protein